MLSGWQPNQALLDPMCGGGTIIIEAGLMAANIPPGMNRSFAFERYRGLDKSLWQRSKTTSKSTKPRARFMPRTSAHAVNDMANNLQRAGLPFPVAFEQNNALSVMPPPATSGVMVYNPPYGERIDVTTADETAVFFKQWADHLKAHYAGWNAYIFNQRPRYAEIHASVGQQKHRCSTVRWIVACLNSRWSPARASLKPMRRLMRRNKSSLIDNPIKKTSAHSRPRFLARTQQTL